MTNAIEPPQSDFGIKFTDIEVFDHPLSELEIRLVVERNESRYWARRMMKERDTLQDQLDVVIKIDDDIINTWRGTCDILQAKLDAVIMKIESVCRGEYSGEDPYYILRNYIKSIKE